MFKKILIANRGEIAIRVIRACREMGISTVAVYSEADRPSLHVRFADEAYCVGPAPSTESYLAMERIIEVAKKAHAEAVHPGYGFLAENAAFSELCEREGITFIGPSSKAMRATGSKTSARTLAQGAGVPVVPGTTRNLSDEEVAQAAAEMGYPILIKAAGGGGGKGMRVVSSPEKLPSSIRDARSEASSSFGDPSIYVEKYLTRPRHIEMQVLADNYGNVIYLGERECSIQRRHQKVIEESPSPIMDADLRRRMGEAAVALAKASGYNNAGTMEFLVDQERNFYFLEVNARLQVEHPVTELVTGIDLVKEQVLIASGEKLHYQQGDIELRGAAIECRIYAEDPDRNFMPSPGKILALRSPAGPGVRDESGVYEGYEVPIYYDPLISKLVTWGRDRREALERMRRALQEYVIQGIKTTIPFHQWVMEDPDFLKGDFDTTFIDTRFAERWAAETKRNKDLALIAAAIYAYLREKKAESFRPAVAPAMGNPWKMAARQNGLRRR